MDGRGRRGRRIARGMIGLAVGCGVAIVVLWLIYPPSFMDPLFGVGQSYAWVAPVIGVPSYFLGLAWMIRIFRAARSEPGERSWRYRDL